MGTDAIALRKLNFMSRISEISGTKAYHQLIASPSLLTTHVLPTFTLTIASMIILSMSSLTSCLDSEFNLVALREMTQPILVSNLVATDSQRSKNGEKETPENTNPEIPDIIVPDLVSNLVATDSQSSKKCENTTPENIDPTRNHLTTLTRDQFGPGGSTTDGISVEIIDYQYEDKTKTGPSQKICYLKDDINQVVHAFYWTDFGIWEKMTKHRFATYTSTIVPENSIVMVFGYGSEPKSDKSDKSDKGPKREEVPKSDKVPKREEAPKSDRCNGFVRIRFCGTEAKFMDSCITDMIYFASAAAWWQQYDNWKRSTVVDSSKETIDSCVEAYKKVDGFSD